MDRKGFTLIELIAAITILALIMLVAVPNVVSIMIKNKNQTYVNDARKLLTLAKYRFESDASITKPSGNTCVVFYLNALDRTELVKGPESGTYDLFNSFVRIQYSGGKYVYSVQLVEVYSKGASKYRKGIPLVEEKDLIVQGAGNKLVSSEASSFKQLNSFTSNSNSTPNINTLKTQGICSDPRAW